MYSVKRRKKMTVPEGRDAPSRFQLFEMAPSPALHLITFLYIIRARIPLRGPRLHFFRAGMRQ